METIPPIERTDDMPLYINNAAIKALGDGRIGGYLVAFGMPRDAHDEYFRRDVKFYLDWYKQRPVLYEHGLSKDGKTAIGIIDTLRIDDHGLYAEAQLDINHEDPAIRAIARKAYDEVNSGLLSWSSGSMPHLVVTDDDGGIAEWPVVEGSLTRRPAERYRTNVSALRSLLEGPIPPEINHAMPHAVEPEATPVAADEHPVRVEIESPILSATGVINMVTAAKPPAKKAAAKMDMAALLAAMNEVSDLSPETKLVLLEKLAMAEGGGIGEVEEGIAADVPAVDPPVIAADDAPEYMMSKSEMQRIIHEEVTKAQKRAAPPKEPPAATGENPMEAPRNPRIEVKSKYADLSAQDMSYLVNFYYGGMAAKYRGQSAQPTSAMIRELADKAQKSYSKDELSIDRDIAIKFIGLKDNELDNTQVAAAAGDWVPTLWSSELWRRVRLPTTVAGSIRSIDMPAPTYELPIETLDPIVYAVPETTNEAQLTLASSANPIPDSTLGAGKVELVARKLGLRVGFSNEENEDSIIPFIPQLRDQALKAMANAVDNVILNGDTETGTTNINYDGSAAPASAKYIYYNGMRKLALVTNPANAVNVGGSQPTLQLIRQARFLMQNTLNYYALYPSELVMFCDPFTYGVLLNIDELNVWMNNGRSATVNTGDVPNIDGVELYPSEQLVRSATDGYINADGTGNTFGTLVIAARQGWMLGYRRQITSSVDFLPYYDSYQMTTTIRIAVKNRDTATAAVLYNIGVG